METNGIASLILPSDESPTPKSSQQPTPTPTMARDPADVLARLVLLQNDDAVNLLVSSSNYGAAARHADEEIDENEAPIMTRFLDDDANGTLKTLTNFSVTEFDTLWGLVEGTLVSLWSTGRGRRNAIAPRDALFMTLTVLKHYDTWLKHSIDFGVGLSSLEKVVHKIITAIEPVLYDRLVRAVKMGEQVQAGHVFRNYPQALYATDVKFQPAYRPSGRFTEQKTYFSAKHKLYGFKIEVSVAPPGLAVDMSTHSPGSASDLTILLDRVSVHRRMLRKESDATIEYRAEPTEFPNSWRCSWTRGIKAHTGCFARSSQ